MSMEWKSAAALAEAVNKKDLSAADTISAALQRIVVSWTRPS